MPIASLKNHIDIHYTFTSEPSDERPVLLLSNSLGTTLSMWDPQVAAFSKAFRLLRYDYRGHGGSAKPAGPYSLPLLAGDVLGLLDHLNIDKVHFCGLSLGGMVGMQLCIEAPQRVRRAVLCNTNSFTATPHFWQDRIDLVLREGTQAIAEGVMARFFSPAFAADHPEVVASFRAGLANMDAVGYAGCCAAIRDMDLRAGNAGIQVPVQVIAGSLDQASQPAQGQLIAQTIPGARYLEIDAAHISNVEAPQEFAAAVLNFLNE